jgi:monomeric isocitrate dehydrogenase
VKELDNRGSNFYVALHWAERLAEKDAAWRPLAQQLRAAEQQIVKEMIDCQVSNPICAGLCICCFRARLWISVGTSGRRRPRWPP